MSHSFFLSNEPCFYAGFPDGEPFANAEAAWFWCVRTSDVIHGGARYEPGQNPPRPCEAVDIQKIVLRLADRNILTDRHARVLVTYGRRQQSPSRPVPAHYWHQAMTHMTPILQRKGIIL